MSLPNCKRMHPEHPDSWFPVPMKIQALRLLGSCAFLLVVTTALGEGKPAQKNRSATEAHAAKTTLVGLASYYGKGLQGKVTASGEVFDKNEMVAAHPTYPLGTRVRVTNLKNGRTQDVRIIDRGPAQIHRGEGVIIDLSENAAVKLGFREQGRTRVKTEVLQ